MILKVTLQHSIMLSEFQPIFICGYTSVLQLSTKGGGSEAIVICKLYIIYSVKEIVPIINYGSHAVSSNCFCSAMSSHGYFCLSYVLYYLNFIVLNHVAQLCNN